MDTNTNGKAANHMAGKIKRFFLIDFAVNTDER